MTLRLVPITLRQARRFVAEHHRHNDPDRGWICGAGLEADGVLVGVAVLGRPKARELANRDGRRGVEVTRVCTDGTRNAGSMLYGAMCRAAGALGYDDVYSYTLVEESGASLRAVGFEVDAELGERPAWEYTGQYRMQHDLFGNDRRPPGPKIRWRRRLR